MADGAGTGGDTASWSRRLRHEPVAQATADHLSEVDAGALDSSVGFAAAHTQRYLATNGADDGWDGPRPILVLYTTGRRSGRTRRNPLLYLDHGGERFLIGSKGGADTHPVWYLNILAEPRVHVRVMAELYEARAETLGPAERAAVWSHLVADYPMFAEYQAATTHEIPVIRLVPVAPAAPVGADPGVAEGPAVGMGRVSGPVPAPPPPARRRRGTDPLSAA